MSKNIVKTQIASAQSMSADFISPVTTIKYMDNVAYQINVITSNSIGTFSVQGCLDYDPNVGDLGTWITLPLGGPNSGVPTINAASDNIMIDMNQLPFIALRLVYDATTAGTGVCDIWLVGKQLGGS